MNTFQLDIKRFKEKVQKRTKTVLQKTAMDIDRGVVMATRVDTGRARGGWNVGVNNVNLSETGEDPSGQKTISENEMTITRAEAEDTIFVSNNVDYIKHLNDGTEHTRGDFMVEKTLRRFPQIVREGVSTAKRENP